MSEPLSPLKTNAAGPVRGVHGPLALWLNRAEQNGAGGRADTDCPLGRGDLTGRKNFGCLCFVYHHLAAVDHRSIRDKRDGVDLESLTTERRPGTRRGRAPANVAINSQSWCAPADSGVLGADLRRQRHTLGGLGDRVELTSLECVQGGHEQTRAGLGEPPEQVSRGVAALD